MMIGQKVKVKTFEPHSYMVNPPEVDLPYRVDLTPDDQFNKFVEENDIIFVDFKAYKNTLVLIYIEK